MAFTDLSFQKHIQGVHRMHNKSLEEEFMIHKQNLMSRMRWDRTSPPAPSYPALQMPACKEKLHA